MLGVESPPDTPQAVQPEVERPATLAAKKAQLALLECELRALRSSIAEAEAQADTEAEDASMLPKSPHVVGEERKAAYIPRGTVLAPPRVSALAAASALAHKHWRLLAAAVLLVAFSAVLSLPAWRSGLNRGIEGLYHAAGGGGSGAHPLPAPPPPPSALLRYLDTPLVNSSRVAPLHTGGAPGATDCSSAVPLIVLIGEAPSEGAPVRGPAAFAPLPPPPPSPQLPSAPTGWLDIRLVDGPPPGATDWAPGPCFHGEFVPYPTERCPYEGGNGGANYGQQLFAARGWSVAGHYTGGNGYDTRLDGPSLVWGPTVDNRDGTYTLRVRVEDPGYYEVQVFKNAERGCAFAECDVSGSLCPKQGYYHEGWKQCWGDAPGPCARRVASLNISIYPRPGALLPRERATLRTCTPKESGTAPGRWVRREVAQAHTRYSPPYFGPLNASDEPAHVPFPYVWQFYDCALEWMDRTCVRACVKAWQVSTVGFSRERAAMFEIAEFMDEGFEHLKLHSAARLGVQHPDGSWGLIHNISHVSTYSAFEADQASWNQGLLGLPGQPALQGLRPLMAATEATLRTDLAGLGLCFNDTRPTAILFAVESLWPSWNMYSGRWRAVAEAFIEKLRLACPSAALVHKTSNAARISAGSLTWQRMFGASRQAADAALAAGIPTVDAFVMTQPWVPDGTVLPDGLHSYVVVDADHPRPDEQHTTYGNFVARTISQLFLKQVCTASCRELEGLGEAGDDWRRDRRASVRGAG